MPTNPFNFFTLRNMRLYHSRTVVYVVCVVLCTIFLVSLRHNTRSLADLETRLVIGGYHVFPRDKFASEKIKGDTGDTPGLVPQHTQHPSRVWDTHADKYGDRILEQLQFVPRSYSNRSAFKYILVPDGLSDTPPAQKKFLDDKCLVDRCHLISGAKAVEPIDAVLVQNGAAAMAVPRARDQIWILWMLESPSNSISLRWLNEHVINWTATFRSDSTIVTPYEKFVPYSNYSSLPIKTDHNYAKGKTKLVAWFVSNCAAMNKRMQYAEQLQRYVTVDIFGACGPHQCSRGHVGNKCDAMLRTDYKFYLSFENSNCEYYITEKLFWNALQNNVVPIVMGARATDYLHAAPPASYIHVEDFPSPRDLARYLLKLDEDDDLYNSYFRWKTTGKFINTKFWCRMCAMLHDKDKPSLWIDDVERWWRGNGTCTKDRWDSPNDVIDWADFNDY